MNFTIMTLLLAGGLFLAVLFFLEIGRRIGLAALAKEANAIGTKYCFDIIRQNATVVPDHTAAMQI